jgi:hypothetical protein
MSIWLGVFFVLLFLPYITKSDSSFVRIFKTILLLAAGFLAYLFKTYHTKGIKLALWCYAFMMLGYSTYFTTLIRSNANPSIDMNNVDNPMSLVYYLSASSTVKFTIRTGITWHSPRKIPTTPGYIIALKKEK